MTKPTEVNDVAPSSVSHVVGQQGVIEQVKVAIDAAFQDSRRFDHAMLVGPPGMGKSMVANVIAQEMATDFLEVLGQSIANVGDLNALLLQATANAVLHIDECHELDKKLQTALYLALDKRKVFISGGKAVQSIPIADFTLLLSTTDEYCLLQPLRDRMRLVLRFAFYSEADLTTLLHQRMKALGWDADEKLFPLIAKRSRGTPRWALRLLQSCRRVCRSEGSETITLEHLQRACDLEQIDDHGLGPTEQAYLRLLAEGPVRLNVIASALGLPARTVSQVTEPFLIRAGLVAKDDQSRRQLTAAGFKHVSNCRS
ncbi:MAG: Holliday junction DNA helicase RuvB C-terminal domain-containing protein [Thermoguttaceae bacterium]|jgi:Holliday junction DNA helicase RuvB|nr:Holliday junction DNA helicase RuvB C-terminal domain-containing protein [Thermoguttaceae bacterium]